MSPQEHLAWVEQQLASVKESVRYWESRRAELLETIVEAGEP